MIRVLLIAALVGACAPKSSQPLEPPPAWKSDDGRKAVWRDLAEWYINNDLPGQALEMVTRLREEGENSRDLDLIQGRALLAQGMPEEARYILEEVADSRPRDAAPLRALGLVYADLGETELAIEALERAVKLQPDDPAARNNLAFLLLADDRCGEATQHLEQVISNDATNPRYKNNLAFALVCEGEPQRALTLFRSTKPEADARYNMGVAYERLDKFPSAILQYREALSADPAHEGAIEALARIELPVNIESPGVKP